MNRSLVALLSNVYSLVRKLMIVKQLVNTEEIKGEPYYGVVLHEDDCYPALTNAYEDEINLAKSILAELRQLPHVIETQNFHPTYRQQIQSARSFLEILTPDLAELERVKAEKREATRISRDARALSKNER